MCSRRLNLLRAHLLLAKHFNPHLNLSVSFLSQSSLGMCAMQMNAHIILCAAVRGGVRVWHIYGMSAWVIGPFRSPCFSLSLVCPPRVHCTLQFLCLSCFWRRQVHLVRLQTMAAIWTRRWAGKEKQVYFFLNPRKINWKKKFWVFRWKKKRSACVEITVFLRITGAFSPPVMVLKWISSFISDFHKQSKVLRTLKPTTCMYFLQSAATTLCWPAATQVHMTAKTTQRHVSVWTKMLHVSQIFRGGFLTTFSNTFHHHVSVEEPQKRRDSLHSAASFFQYAYLFINGSATNPTAPSQRLFGDFRL